MADFYEGRRFDEEEPQLKAFHQAPELDEDTLRPASLDSVSANLLARLDDVPPYVVEREKGVFVDWHRGQSMPYVDPDQHEPRN